MKTVQKLNNDKLPIIAIDPALDKYKDKIMFPKKLEKANGMLKTAKLPSNRHSHLKEFENILPVKD